mmetsp:Transcript_31389/g.53656  ORF Transcript_31389/g.53656 Transcript_31389/m.53656 type:complete len:625 (+) Transcript_31389:25-1899(+)
MTSHKQSELIDWVNQQVAPHHIVVTNLTTCFHDGITLCAIIHSYYAVPIPFEDLVPGLRKFNVELAFAEAENVGIPPLMQPKEIWLARAPDQERISYLISQWRRYLEMEGEDVKADLVEKSDFLKVKFNEQAQRCKGYREELRQLFEDFKDTSQYAQCKRCGDIIILDQDSHVNHDGVEFHEDCSKCYNCSADSDNFQWHQGEIWCPSCKALSEEQLGSGSTAAELESRLLEIKQIEAVRKEKNDPFREMERKREEERRKRLEQFKQRQLEKSAELSAETNETKNAEDEEKEKEKEAIRVRRTEEERARKQAEEDLLARKREEEERIRKEAVQAEDVGFEGLKQKRGEELEEIKANKKIGLSPFREMERKQEEERRKKFLRFSSATSTETAEKQNVPEQRTTDIAHKRVTTNPFAEMEKKRQQEKLARLKRYASLSKGIDSAGEEKSEEPEKPVEKQQSVEEPPKPQENEEIIEEPQKKSEEIQPESPKSVPVETNTEEPPKEEEKELQPKPSQTKSEEIVDTAVVTNEDTKEIIDQIQVGEEPKDTELKEEIQANEQFFPDLTEEIELLLEAAEIVEEQKNTIERQSSVIEEQEELLKKQRETIKQLERELADIRESTASKAV